MADGAEIRILYVGEDPESAADAAAALEGENGSFTVETAPDQGRGLEQLTPTVDCIVSVYDLPGGNGIEFLRAVRERYTDLPFILLTGEGTGSESVASAAISADVTEYLRWGIDGDQYAALAEAMRRMTDPATQGAYTDGCTGFRDELTLSRQLDAVIAAVGRDRSEYR